jgi:hypothetical protein
MTVWGPGPKSPRNISPVESPGPNVPEVAAGVWSTKNLMNPSEQCVTAAVYSAQMGPHDSTVELGPSET